VFFPFTRLIALIMAAVLCFGILVPMSLERRNPALAILIGVVFAGYLVANVVLWQRMRPRA
jgi:hypothetical protein